MKRFWIKILLITSPFLIGFFSVIITDPYKLLYHYENYSYNTFPVNRDFISTEYFIEHNPKYHYDAFIFGNSRSSAFHTTDWINYIDEPVSPYHFDASAESLFGINRKCVYLDSVGSPIKYAIILLDTETLMQVRNRDYHVFTKHYKLTGQSKLDFYMMFFKSMSHKHFFKFYIDYLLGGAITDMAQRMPRDMACVPITNDYVFSGCEEALKIGEDKYFSMYDTYFKKRPTTEETSEQVIFEKQKVLLEEIKNIFDKKETNYQIIISPSYSQKAFNSLDYSYLTSLFGKEYVHDFSGKNEFTNDIRNYYDGSHYRPSVGKAILEKIYTNK